MDFSKKVEELLKQSPYFCDDRGEVLKEKVIKEANNYNTELIALLLDDSDIKSEFFVNANGTYIFKLEMFMSFIKNKSFLPDSYTAFNNKIGFNISRELDNNVVLDFPYKDCYLEGGQTKDESKRKEIFFNKILARDQISNLLEPKVLVNTKRIDKDGEREVTEFNIDANGDIKDNLLIKGNNLLALHSLKERFAGKVKLIYIDPPYNTGKDSFGYNDSFNHSSWLVFMKNRLAIAKELLRDDGVIFVQCDDNEQAYLKVLMDEIFGRENFTRNIIWEKKYSPANDSKTVSDNHDFIMLYAKKIQCYKLLLLQRTEIMNNRYTNPDNDNRGNWKSGGLSAKSYDKKYDYPITTPSNNIVYPPTGSCWQINKQKLEELIHDNRIYWGKNNNSKPQIKQFLSEVQQGSVPKSIWTYKEVGHNQIGRSEITKLFNGFPFNTPKPEQLLQRIIEISTNEGELVLDFFAGSGTTAAVAHKMNRQWITTEQMDYIDTITKERLKKVIAGEQGGISKSLNWQGGGDFISLELATYNQDYIDMIGKAKDTAELHSIYEEIKKNDFTDYLIDFKDFDKKIDDFNKLSLDEQKKTLCNTLNLNMLYIPISSLEDTDYSKKISSNDKMLNRKFYDKSSQ